MKDKSPLFQRAVTLIKKIPKGKVASYGQVAELISAPGCARHVSYILSSSSKKYKLPWHRVVSSSGEISPHKSSFNQKKLLKAEGIELVNDKVDFGSYAWKPTKKYVREILKGLPKHKSVFLR